MRSATLARSISPSDSASLRAFHAAALASSMVRRCLQRHISCRVAITLNSIGIRDGCFVHCLTKPFPRTQKFQKTYTVTTICDSATETETKAKHGNPYRLISSVNVKLGKSLSTSPFSSAIFNASLFPTAIAHQIVATLPMAAQFAQTKLVADSSHDIVQSSA